MLGKDSASLIIEDMELIIDELHSQIRAKDEMIDLLKSELASEREYRTIERRWRIHKEQAHSCCGSMESCNEDCGNYEEEHFELWKNMMRLNE